MIDKNALLIGSNEISKEAKISAFCIIENSIILGNAKIGEYTIIRNSIVDNSIIGRNCIIENSNINKNTLIYDYCKIEFTCINSNTKIFDYTSICSKNNDILKIGKTCTISDHQSICESLVDNSFVQPNESNLFLDNYL